MDEKQLVTYFRALGLEPGASLSDVKEAYKFLVQTFHEDKYPAGHPYREKAHEKMICINDAYEKLRQFFAECPSGIPEGGWTHDQQHDNEEQSTDGLDWQDWQRGQEASWQSELSEWSKADELKRKNMRSDEDKKRRGIVVTAGKAALVLAFFSMLLGHGGSHALHGQTNAWNDSYLREKLKYDLSTNGTAGGASIMNASQIMRQDMPLINMQNERDRAEKQRDDVSALMLLLMGCGLTWVFVSKKSNNMAAHYVNGKQKKAEKEKDYKHA